MTAPPRRAADGPTPDPAPWLHALWAPFARILQPSAPSAGSGAVPSAQAPPAFPVPAGLSVPARAASHASRLASDLLAADAAPGLLRKVGREVARDVSGHLGAGDLEEALLELDWHWRSEGLGALRVLGRGPEGVAFAVTSCWECRAAAPHPHGPAPRLCSVTSGFVEEALGRATSEAWSVAELECRASEGGACRFLAERAG